MPRVTVGVSLKTYFGNERATSWFTEVESLVRDHPAVTSGAVGVFVVPTYLQIPSALTVFAGSPVEVAAQDVSQFPRGAYTGEITAHELEEIGVELVEVGHAERRRLFGETDDVVSAKVTAALTAGLTPVLCIGESERTDPARAATAAVSQLEEHLRGAPEGAVVIAYEPVWAIGAAEPAPAEHVIAVTSALRAWLDRAPARRASTVLYGGSAGPGLLTLLTARDAHCVDGLFLGRFAHDPLALGRVLDEAATLAESRA